MKKIVMSLFLVFLLAGCTKESNKPEMALEDFDQTVLALQMGDEVDLGDDCSRLFISEQQDYCEILLGEYLDGSRLPVDNIIYTKVETEELTESAKSRIDLNQYSEVFEVTFEYTIADDSTTHKNQLIMVFDEGVYYFTEILEEE